MKIIADTNIWYYFGQDNEMFEKAKSKPISPTWVNIYELSKTENLIDKEEQTRAAIKKLFAFPDDVIFEPPFIYIARLHNDFEFDPMGEYGNILKFTELFAQGFPIEPLKIEEFRKELQEIGADLTLGAEFFNKEAENIRKNIKNKRVHKNINTYQITSDFINSCIKSTTQQKYNIIGFDLNRIELLVRTLDHFFKTLETSKMKFQANDWFDLAILGYVQPGDKYWTSERRWRNLIKEAGCEGYLYE